MKIKQTILDFIKFVKDYDTKFTLKYVCITIIVLQVSFILAYNHWVNPNWIATKKYVIHAVLMIGDMLKYLGFKNSFKVLWSTIAGFFEMQLHLIAISFWIWLLVPIRYSSLYRKFKINDQEMKDRVKQQHTPQVSKPLIIQQNLKETPRRGRSTL
jgi:hypothetical protein